MTACSAWRAVDATRQATPRLGQNTLPKIRLTSYICRAPVTIVAGDLMHGDLIDIVADIARVDSTVNHFHETAVPHFIQANHTSACEDATFHEVTQPRRPSENRRCASTWPKVHAPLHPAVELPRASIYRAVASD